MIITDAAASEELVVDDIIDNGFLKSFVDYAKEQTDSPEKFLLMSGLIALAGAVGNRIWVRAWGQRIFPNIWVLLIAPSGIYRKNTAIDLGLNLLRKASEGRLAPADFSREAWLDGLKVNPSQVMVSKEFGELLTKLSRDYMAGTKETLTDLFTSVPVYERVTKGGGIVKIEWPCISLIGGSSLIWLQERLKNSDFEGGFMARFLIVTATQKNGWLGIRPFRDETLEDTLVEYLRKLDNRETGSISIDEIEGEYNMWLMKYENSLTQGRIPSVCEGFASRMGTFCLKLSMLFELSNNPDATVISPESFDKAIMLLKCLQNELAGLIEKGLAVDKTGRELERLRAYIQQNGEVSHSDTLRFMKCDARYFQKLIDTLKEREEVEVSVVDTAGRKRKVYVPKSR